MINTEINKATMARDLGFPIGGFIEDIYVGAEILIPETMWGYRDEFEVAGDRSEEMARKYDDKYLAGKVLHIQPVFIQLWGSHESLWEWEAEQEENVHFTDDEVDEALKASVEELRTKGHKISNHYVMHFTLLTKDGLQLPIYRGKGSEIYMAHPLDAPPTQ